MKEKTYYITEDGWKFENALDAKEHEDKITKEKINRSRVITLDSGKTLTHDEIVEFFNKVNCMECPFCKECDEMYQRCRCSTTDTFTICDVVKGRLMNDARTMNDEKILKIGKLWQR